MKTIVRMVPALLLALATGLAFAQATDKKPVTGTLTATGDGGMRVASFQGNVVVSGGMALMVGPKATVTFDGKEGTRSTRDIPNPLAQKDKDAPATITVTIYRGFDGKATITGDKFMIQVMGKGINLTATGIGRARMMGTGSYTVVNDGDTTKKTGDWTTPPQGAAGNGAAGAGAGGRRGGRGGRAAGGQAGGGQGGAEMMKQVPAVIYGSLPQRPGKAGGNGATGTAGTGTTTTTTTATTTTGANAPAAADDDDDLDLL